jgi:hypothetical protein
MLPQSQDDFNDRVRNSDVDEMRYVGSTHWSAIMDDIHELKVALGGSFSVLQVEEEDLRRPSGPGGELIFGLSNVYSLQDIISQHLPSKAETDRFLSTYFKGETFIIPFIHNSHFHQQYEKFWADPNNVNPLWLSLLFSVCYMASLVAGRQNSYRASQNGPVAGHFNFHVAAGQCLVLGEYHRPQQFGPEALVAYANCKSLKTLDPSREALQILGLVVRMAYEMGYHRDPDSLKGFDVFEGEMRRRFWAVCKQMDLMISFQFGLPTNIRFDNCDTRSPRNLLDSDFSVDTQILPPSRPESEPTRLLWFIVKDRLMAGFGKVCQYALSFEEQSETDVLELDKEVRHLHTTIPDVLRARPFSECVTDEPLLIMVRLYVEFIHLKSLCVLHRRYMARGVNYSTHACIEAGKNLVCQFIDMYNEFTPGGQLHGELWLLSNFTMNDFLLGVMVLCLVVHTPCGSENRNSKIDARTEKEVLSLLEKSLTICIEKSTASKDARRVSQAIRLTLGRAQRQSTGIFQSSNILVIKAHITSDIELKIHPEQPANLSALSLEPEETFSLNDEMSFGSLDPFSFMDNDAGTLDYDYSMFDQQNWDPNVVFSGGFVPEQGP